MVAPVMLVLFGLNRVQVVGITAPLALAPLLTGLVVLGGFIWWQRRSPVPTVDLEMFRVRELSAATLAAFLAFAGLASLILLLPFYLQRGLGLTPVQVGLVLVTIPALMGLIGPPAGTLADRVGPRPVASVGVALTAIGYAIEAWGWDAPLYGVAGVYLVGSLFWAAIDPTKPVVGDAAPVEAA